jgi:hypothetical protein
VAHSLPFWDRAGREPIYLAHQQERALQPHGALSRVADKAQAC